VEGFLVAPAITKRASRNRQAPPDNTKIFILLDIMSLLSEGNAMSHSNYQAVRLYAAE
jgi:hypothetical protein